MLRGLSFIALFQAAGLALFLVLFGHLLTVSLATLKHIGWVSATIAMGLLLAQFGLEAGRMGGEYSAVLDASLQSLALHSPAGVTLAWRLVGLILIALGLRTQSSFSGLLTVAGVMLVIVAFTLVGHTAAHPQRWALSLLLVSHLLILTIWFGALVSLQIAAKRELAVTAHNVTAAFSKFALWVVPCLLVAGLMLSVGLVENFAGLRTTYGQLLLAKVAVFAVLMLLGALNKWRFGPALRNGQVKSR